MDRPYINENNKSRERLKTLKNKLTDKELRLVIYKEGWTIAVALAHLAFWDQRRLALLRKWKQKGVTPESQIDEDFLDTINDGLLPFLSVIPPRKLAEIAISTAEALDKELEELAPEMTMSIEAIGDRHALNRSIHRTIHLDEIESFLKAKRKSK